MPVRPQVKSVHNAKVQLVAHALAGDEKKRQLWLVERGVWLTLMTRCMNSMNSIHGLKIRHFRRHCWREGTMWEFLEGRVFIPF